MSNGEKTDKFASLIKIFGAISTSEQTLRNSLRQIKLKTREMEQVISRLLKTNATSRKTLGKMKGFEWFRRTSREEVSGEQFYKVMEETKAQQSSVATSQKLIAQMMEEMAQVVETLTNATKSALDANGRILRRLSRMS